MKLEPFEQHIGEQPTISYVGIRGDENKEGYISKRENIQAIFPFRKNIWSEDVISKFIDNKNIDSIKKFYQKELNNDDRILLRKLNRKYHLDTPEVRKLIP